MANGGRFPHMLQAESELWSAFLRDFGKPWSGWEYDVHVGEGISVGSAYDVMTQGLARALTQKRIDAVGHRKGVVWIFEVKLQAALSAVGQLVGYQHLYRITFKYEGPIELAIVTDRLLPDDERVFRLQGIHIFLVVP
jgi:hypothetical protein